MGLPHKQGYYSNHIGEAKAAVIKTCLMSGDNLKKNHTCLDLHTNNSGKKPPLTDSDQAKVLVQVDPTKIPVNGLDLSVLIQSGVTILFEDVKVHADTAIWI